MLEDLLPSLIPGDDPLWPHARKATDEAAKLVDEANSKISAAQDKWRRFSNKVRIKAEIRCWLAWQHDPGLGIGAAINNHILGHNSEQALAFLKWLKQLYQLSSLAV